MWCGCGAFFQKQAWSLFSTSRASKSRCAFPEEEKMIEFLQKLFPAKKLSSQGEELLKKMSALERGRTEYEVRKKNEIAALRQQNINNRMKFVDSNIDKITITASQLTEAVNKAIRYEAKGFVIAGINNFPYLPKAEAESDYHYLFSSVKKALEKIINSEGLPLKVEIRRVYSHRDRWSGNEYDETVLIVLLPGKVARKGDEMPSLTTDRWLGTPLRGTHPINWLTLTD
jgi:hypothetical protein